MNIAYSPRLMLSYDSLSCVLFSGLLTRVRLTSTHVLDPWMRRCIFYTTLFGQDWTTLFYWPILLNRATIYDPGCLVEFSGGNSGGKLVKYSDSFAGTMWRLCD